ncbi:hypothetical protein MASR2M117_05570 [Paludibacter sp.]
MNNRVLYISFFILVAIFTNAQKNNPRFSREEVINQKWTFVKEKAGLTSEEVQIVEPIFRDNEIEFWKLLSKNRELFRRNHQQKGGETPNYEAINESMVDFEVNNALNQKQYYLRLKSTKLPASTINRILNADKDFKRDLMQRNPPMGPGRHIGGQIPQN